MKTGRMAPVKGQLTDGPLHPAVGRVYTQMCTQRQAPPLLGNTAKRSQEI